MCVIADITTDCHTVRTWGSGCSCHEELRLAGKKVEPRCNAQGKHLSESPVARATLLEHVSNSVYDPGDNHMWKAHKLAPSYMRLREFAYRRLEVASRELFDPYSHLPSSLAYVTTTAQLRTERHWYRAVAWTNRNRFSYQLFEGGDLNNN